MGVSRLLPVGAYVLVRDPGCYSHEDGREIFPPREYYGIVRGHSLGGDKYQVGNRFGGWGEWLFLKGGDWPFRSWCSEVTEEESTQLPGEAHLYEPGTCPNDPRCIYHLTRHAHPVSDKQLPEGDSR